MKSGMILYVAQGNEDTPRHEPEELIRIVREQGVHTVCVAESEEEVIHGWWHLVVRGMHRVFLMTVAFDPLGGKFEFRNGPLRLYG